MVEVTVVTKKIFSLKKKVLKNHEYGTSSYSHRSYLLQHFRILKLFDKIQCHNALFIN